MSSSSNYKISLLTPKDAILLFELIQANAKRLHQYFPVIAKQNSSLSDTKTYIVAKKLEASQRENYTFKITNTSTQLPVGLLIIKNIHWDTKECQLAYFIDSAHEGKGIISSGISQLITYCKEKLQLQKLIVRIGEDNTGSLRIAEKHNFILTKRVKNVPKDFHGNSMDVLHFKCTL
jgi:RimJ/RimL family protein N-acetyltransferase